jgi:hypothetical protein
MAWRLDPKPRPTSRPAARFGARCPNATDNEACRRITTVSAIESRPPTTPRSSGAKHARHGRTSQSMSAGLVPSARRRSPSASRP